MKRAMPCLAALSLSLSLTGCVGTRTHYPSLALRDAERVEGTALPADPDAAPAPPPPVESGTQARIAQLVDDARRAHAEFAAHRETASRTILAARGAQPPADGWIVAQVALAGLQTQRSNAVIALGELDQLYSEERLANPGEATPTARAIDAARAQVVAWIEDENRVIAGLASQIAG